MIRLYFFVIYLACLLVHVEARSERAKLMKSAEVQGDQLYIRLYWHPDSCKLFREMIPSSNRWVGFEGGLWDEVAKEKKVGLLNALGAKLEAMELEKRKKWWARQREWSDVKTQLSLIASYLSPESDEDFIEFTYKDPELRPAYQWILDSRGPNFDSKHVSTTLSAGEHQYVFPRLVEHLMGLSQKQRLECYARLLTKNCRESAEVRRVGGGALPEVC